MLGVGSFHVVLAFPFSCWHVPSTEGKQSSRAQRVHPDNTIGIAHAGSSMKGDQLADAAVAQGFTPFNKKAQSEGIPNTTPLPTLRDKRQRSISDRFSYCALSRRLMSSLIGQTMTSIASALV